MDNYNKFLDLLGELDALNQEQFARDKWYHTGSGNLRRKMNEIKNIITAAKTDLMAEDAKNKKKRG